MNTGTFGKGSRTERGAVGDDVERTCAPPAKLEELRPGQVIRYQTEAMACEARDVVVQLGPFSATLEGGREITGADWFVIVEEGEATNGTKDTKKMETETPSAGSEPGGTHTETKTMAKHTAGPNMDAEHWGEFVGLVIGLVDESECLLVEAVSAANETLGTGHSMGSYRKWSKKLGMRPKTTRGELVSRERRRRKERAAGRDSGGDSGGTRHAVSVPRPEPELPSPEPAEGAGPEGTDCDVLPPPEPVGPVDMISRTIDLLMGRAKPYLDAVATLQETRTALLEAGE